MNKTVLVAIKKPNQPLEVREIEDKLEVLQEIVEGYIDLIYSLFFSNNADIISCQRL